MSSLNDIFCIFHKDTFIEKLQTDKFENNIIENTLCSPKWKIV